MRGMASFDWFKLAALCFFRAQSAQDCKDIDQQSYLIHSLSPLSNRLINETKS